MAVYDYREVLADFVGDIETFVAFRRAISASLEAHGLGADAVESIQWFPFERTLAYRQGGYCGAGYAFSPNKRKRKWDE
jgi:hypothetical protein